MAVTHTTPLTTTRVERAPLAVRDRPQGADFEAPLHTVPYPVRECRDACLETRDIDLDDDGSLF